MHLKKLEIQGFKSFVDKLTLDFGAGITTVVGPNGSGKSNISDAIRWVLGEQSAKSLRGGKMEDVIFVGTESRRPVGFAEVSLTIENEDGKLPIAFEEVKVTRRLYRSGESEYLINMSQCRLKDIQQLFFDTGIGVDGYSIIGQGQVDSILSGKVEERRAIFEEASGIMKYKIRKTESERKLVLTTQNIERISDIVRELEHQVGPLSEQAEIARTYLGLKEELKDYEISVYVDSITKVTGQVKELTGKYTNIQQDIEIQNAALDAIQITNEEKQKAYQEIEARLEAMRNLYYENEKLLSEQGADRKVIEEKLHGIEENNRRLQAEIEELQKQIFHIAAEQQTLQEGLERLEQERTAEQCLLQELQEKYAVVMELMSQRTKTVEEHRTQLQTHSKEQAECISRISALKQRLAGNQIRREEIEKEIQAFAAETKEFLQVKEAGKAAAQELQEQMQVLQAERNQYIAVKEKNEKRLEALKAEAGTLSSEYQFKSSRLHLLNEMEEKMEGYHRSVREIISAVEERRFAISGIQGTIAQLITVEQTYELAVETALGQAFQYIVTDTEQTAKQAIEYLRNHKLGRATFLPMTAVNGKTLERTVAQRLEQMPGYIGLGHEVVQYDSRYHNVMLSQLGKVAIVDALDNAIEIARTFQYSFKIITLKGDIIRPSGAMTGGSIEKAVSSGVLGRKRDMESLTERTRELAGIIKQMNEEAMTCTVKISNSVLEAGKLEAEYRGVEIKLVEARSVSQRVDERIAEIETRTQSLQQDIETLQNNTRCTEKEIQSGEQELHEIEESISLLQMEIQKSEQENSTGRAAVDAMNQQLTEKKLLVNSLDHRIETTMENARRLSQQGEIFTQEIETKKGLILENQRLMGEMTAANHELEQRISQYMEKKTGQSGELERMTSEKQRFSEELMGMTNQIAEVSKQVYLLQEEYNRLEVRKAKLEAEEENCRKKLWEEYEITYGNAMDYIRKKELGSFAFMQKRIQELRGQIRELGDINVNAIEDYKNTKERLVFLQTQMEDLEKSKLKLEKIIQDMSLIMKKQFLDHFELINQSFYLVFRELFDGGRANILITDRENVLESPIEIEVQPPGKKLQSMSLLSGGEKALTAIALLFAVLRLKPTPFCVLDEIEAALDDTNVIRFAEYVTKFSDNTQFVIITHRKGTMEAADVLYGVTMEERGVSKIVSMKLEFMKE